MKIAELRQLTPKKLLETLQKFERELAVTQFHVQTGQNKNSSRISTLRKIIARIKTIQNSKK